MAHTVDKTIITLLLSAVVVTALAHGAVEPWSVAIFELMVVALILLWTAKAMMDKRLELYLPQTAWPMAGLLVLGIAQAVAVTGAGGEVRSLSLDVEATRSALLTLFLLCAAFVIAANLLTDHLHLRWFSNFVSIYGLALAAFSIIQYFTWNGKFYWVRPDTTGVEPFGPFVNHNHYAGYIELLMPIPMALAASRAVRGEARLWYGFSAAVMAVSAILSRSRGGMIALGVEFLFLMLATHRITHYREEASGSGIAAWQGFRIPGGRYLVIPFFVLAIGAGVMWIGAEPVIERLARPHISTESGLQRETFFTSRGWIWRDTLSMIVAHPVMGVGLGAFKTAYPIYSHSDGSLEVGQAHNDYLQVMADLGLIGLGFLIWFLVLVTRAMRRSVKSTDPFASAVALGSSAGIVGILVHSLVDFNLQLPANALLFLILVAIVSKVGSGKVDPQESN